MSDEVRPGSLAENPLYLASLDPNPLREFGAFD
jgi:hypothetical protein